MAGSLGDLCKNLEEHNAQIDVWIDDEEYDSIWDSTDDATGIITLSEEAKEKVRKCFPDDNGYCTHGKDKEWRKALDFDEDTLPVEKVSSENLRQHKKARIVRAWSRLFYAKLLRALIQQRGTDCYFRRLDDVIAYLENSLPRAKRDNKDSIKLAVIYFLELSAASLGYEQAGFAERAKRMIKDHRKEVGEEFYNFYDLWARYNIGVTYFHDAQYRKAILEFNMIIWQAEEWKKDDDKGSLGFFGNHKGVALLYLPAILHRAEVQLKLQFAYHSLDTLDNRFRKNKNIDITDAITPHKKIHSMIIEVQAYQQMGRWDKSWDVLKEVCKSVTGGVELGKREECVVPEREKLNQKFPSLGGRFLDILIADHLDWLTLQESRKDIVNAYYLKKLADSFLVYRKLARYHASDRKGYYQQLARYLAWLAKAADFKYSGPELARRQKKVEDDRKKIATIARGLYKNNRVGLLEEEKRKFGKAQWKCRYCNPRGIDLGKIDPEHYTWFADTMLKFFNSKFLNSKNFDEAKKEFVKRLIKLERKERDDLRIHDLKLRYEFYDPCVLKDKGEELCLKGLDNREAFAGILECAQKNKENQNDGPSSDYLLTADDYIKIIKNWDDLFLRHLKSPSIHELQESGFYFLGLQRWNSSSPAKGRSVGGGYLLYHTDANRHVDMGIAIDPGFDFVRNLFHTGFSLDDIDIVLISHAHPDHIRDFESIVLLLFELKKRGKREKRVHVILSLGAYKRLEHIVEDPEFRYLVEPYIIDVNRELSDDYFENEEERLTESLKFVNTNGGRGNSSYIERFRALLPGEEENIKTQSNNGLQVTITRTRAYHNDQTRSDSFGFLIGVELAGKDKTKLTFGYTGDTKWVYPDMPDPLEECEKERKEGRKIEDIAKQYYDCDVLLMHLGSLISKDDDDKLSFYQYNQCGSNAGDKYRCEELIREKDHPYLFGMLRLLSSLCSKVKGMPLILLSEFGEELRGTIRSDFINRLQKVYKDKLAFLPVDVGMNVRLRHRKDNQDKSKGVKCASKVWCVQCNEFVSTDEADFEVYGEDEALFCVCKTCRKATPLNVLQDRLRHLYEVGCELRTDQELSKRESSSRDK